MPRLLRALFSRLSLAFLRHRDAESSRVIIGSTGSGKSEGELVELTHLARREDYAVVLLDGHGPLAFRAARAWLERGHARRIIYEPLHATDRALCWTMLPKSAATTPSARLLEDAETLDEVAQCFLAQRNLSTLNDRPWTKEWLDAAIALCLAQPAPEPLASLLKVFQVGSSEYERLLDNCDRQDVVRKFRGLERLQRRSEVQFEQLTGAARRLLELACTSEAVRLRSRPGTFDWLAALRERRLVVFDGGGLRSKEVKRTLFTLASMHVIHAVRRHFSQTQQPLAAVLVLEEAGALGLVTPFVLSALQELRKAGLAIHLITQSHLDFGDRSLFEAVLANTPWQAWYQCLSPADQELGAKALANATFDPLAVHYTRRRPVADGSQPVAMESHGKSVGPRTGEVRRDHRAGTAHVPRFRELIEPQYKTPQLHEQECRTQLATLRIGERFVRDRAGVRRERVRLLRRPLFGRWSDEQTREAIVQIRQLPIYLPCIPDEPAPEPTERPDAAERLREMMLTAAEDGDRASRCAPDRDAPPVESPPEADTPLHPSG